jgi:hypothetical protein
LYSVSTIFLCALSFVLAAAAQAQTPSFGGAVVMGYVSPDYLWEASGLVASRQNPGVLWSHNDSGYPGTLFALSTNGALLGQWTLPNAPIGNYEDIAIGPGPKPGFQYLYLGDIGDNFSFRANIHVYRCPEPAVYQFQASAPAFAYLPEWQDILITYPDGAHDAEGMLVDPITGDLFLFTKADFSFRLYRATRAELDSGEPVTLTFLREIGFRKVSAADISADGSMIAVRRSGSGLLWVRSPGQTVEQALDGSSVSIPLIGQPAEPNGEALGFEANGRGYFTLSESSPTNRVAQPIYFFPRTDTMPPLARAFVGRGAIWQYDDWGDPFGEDWFTPEFEDSFYYTGAAPLGYESGEATTIDYGFPNAKYVTSYFRTRFKVSSVNGLTNLALRICFNDGFAAYLNGTEIARVNLSPGANLDTLAPGSTEAYRRIWHSYPVNPSLVHTGTNVLAIEVHRANTEGAYLNFDAQLVEAGAEWPARFTGKPQVVNSNCVLTIAGPAGQLVKLDTSSDLQSWSSAGTVVLTNGLATFRDAATNGAAFYRIAE